jgi:protein ImuB
MTKVEIETFQSVVTLPRSLAEEGATKAALLEGAGTFSPRIEDRSDGNAFLCVIDIAGTEKLFGQPQTLTKNLLRHVRSLGISATATVSNNFHAAICLARGTSRSDVTVISLGQESATLASLPLAVLNLTEDQGETFALWGIHTLGMLAGSS